MPIFFQHNAVALADRPQRELTIVCSACKDFAPYVRHMREIWLYLDGLRFILYLEKGLQDHHFGIASKPWQLLRNLSLFRGTREEQIKADGFAALIMAKCRSMLDAMAESAILCGEAPVLSLDGVRELMEMILGERDAFDLRMKDFIPTEAPIPQDWWEDRTVD